MRGDDLAPRRFAIQKKDLEHYGFTANCGGCYAAKHEKTHKHNSHDCRDRIMKHLEADETESKRVIDHRDPENRWLEKQIEMADTGNQSKEGGTNEDNVEKIERDEPNHADQDDVERVPRFAEPIDSTEDFYMEINEHINDNLMQ